MLKNAGGLIKPKMLGHGDTIAVISPSWGCAGVPRVRWQYRLGAGRLEELGLNVATAPNALRGTKFLHENPCARAEDFLWAFENKNVKAIIANIGGSDSVRLLPFLSAEAVRSNPKIFCGYSDVMAPLLPPRGIVDILRRQSADNGRRSAGLARIQPRKL